MSSIKWGILGCGSIANAHATAVNETPGAELWAVGSRSEDKARAFAAQHKSHKAYRSYKELAEDPDVQAVYIASPHPMHCENVLMSLENGKAVLCEKPFSINAHEARKMVDVAREKRLFLMEAMWTRFFPIMHRLREEVRKGTIGKVRLVTADFGFRAGFDPKSRIFDPQLGGGALLDVGVYAISFASMILGKPTSIVSTMKPALTGVDAQSGYIFGYPNGELAMLYSSVETNTPCEATVMGEEGRIRVHSPFWKPSRLTIATSENEENVEIPYDGNGYRFQVEEVGRCLNQNQKESAIMPLDETISIMETMDEIRAQWGLRYPSEA